MKINTIEELDKLSFPELVDWVSINKKNYEHYRLSVIELDDGTEWAIAFNDKDADGAAYEYISNTIWAFDPTFLEQMTDVPAEMFEAVQDKCESINEALEILVMRTCGMDNFVDQAISWDGRGHFLSGYDGKEVELECGAYAYRID